LRLTRSSPVVRRLAEEHGVEIAEIPGTGTGGRVTRKDIEGYIEEQEERGAEREAYAPPGLQEEREAFAAPEPEVERVPVYEGDRVEDLTGMRRAIANRMSASKREAPHAWTMVEVDVSGLAALREREKAAFAEREGMKLTYLPFIVRAVVESLREHPVLNSVWDRDRIILRKRINVGVAVDLEDALIVPVITDADELNLVGLARRIEDLVRRARARGLGTEDVSGGTFTVNNPGALGSVVSTPIINHPQAAILSAEAIVKRPVIADDAIAVRSMMNLEVSFDHRVLDGGAALKFLNAVKRRLEEYGPESRVG
jgi:2-oxoisovalerate dehydrogenase E2 component (dihydrolipoyl transacylase)